MRKEDGLALPEGTFLFYDNPRLGRSWYGTLRFERDQYGQIEPSFEWTRNGDKKFWPLRAWKLYRLATDEEVMLYLLENA